MTAQEQRDIVERALRWWLGFPGSTIYVRREGVSQDEYERTIREGLDEFFNYQLSGSDQA